MAYIDVLTLAEAKNHLRVDTTDDDAAITRMINSALSYLESLTNVMVYQRDKTYLMVDGQVLVYDYPINSVESPADYDSDETERKHNYNIYNYGTDTTDLTLSVGYALAADYPQELKEVALEIIDLMYFANETGKNYKKDLSELSKDVINRYKRFYL